jgi:amino acid transporter
MVTCRPLTGALIDLPHTFLDPASGFAIASVYGYVFSSSIRAAR